MLAQLARNQLREVRLLRQQWNAELAINNSMQQVLRVLLTGQITATKVKSGDTTLPIDGNEIVIDGVKVQIQDVAGLMSLGSYDQQSFRRLAEKLTDPANAERLSAELGDWIDRDDFPRYKGMEQADYVVIGSPSLPRNGHLKSLDELLLLPGMTPKIYNGDKQKGLPGLRDLLVPGGMGWFNAASAPEILLGPYLNINQPTVQKIVTDRRTENWLHFEEMVYKGERYFDLPPNTPGIEFRIISQSAKWNARMQIRLKPFKNPPYEILQWLFPDYPRE